MAKKYTDEEDQFIIENCQHLNYAEMTLHLGRPSAESIRQRVEILKRQDKLKYSGAVRDGVFYPLYSKKEDETMKKLYPSLGRKVLANMLNRSESSIQYRASAKLKIKRAPSYFSAIRIARLLKVVQRTVVSWIHQGFLKGSKSGRGAGQFQEWRIEPQDLYKFIRKYYYIYEPVRVTDKSLRLIIESTPAAKAIPVGQAIKVLGISRAEVQRRIKKGRLKAYKSFAGYKGFRGFRWYVLLDESVFEQWFQDLTDNHSNKAAEWLVDVAYWRNPDSMILLNILLKYVPEKVREVRQRIKLASAADSIVRAFEATPAGEQLKNLTG